MDNDIKTTEDRIIRANLLTEGLAEEQIKWKEKMISLNKEYELIFGDSLLIRSCICYFGPFYS